MEESYCVIMTTAGSPAEAQRLAEILVDGRLAACVQAIPMHSTYRWQGSVQRDPETLLLVKTATRLYSQVEAAILANHSYETPEIILVPVTRGSPAYLGWIRDSVTEGDS